MADVVKTTVFVDDIGKTASSTRKISTILPDDPPAKSYCPSGSCPNVHR